MKISFAGDVSFTGSFVDSLNSSMDVFDKDLINFFKKNDFFYVNLEGPCTHYPSLRADLEVVSPPKALLALKEANVSHIGFANNHILDCGNKGFIETIETANYYGLKISGISSDNSIYEFDIFESQGKRIAVLTITQFYRSLSVDSSFKVAVYDSNKFKRTIDKIKHSFDYIVLNYHGGEEYTVYPWFNRRNFLIDLLDVGVDIIICHHSHTVQPYETFDNGKVIFYSLGNFVFDLTIHRTKSFINHGVVVTLDFSDGFVKFEHQPVLIDPHLGKVLSSGTLSNFYDLRKHGYSKFKWFSECFRVVSERNKGVVIDNKISTSIFQRFKNVFFKGKTILFNSEFRAIVLGFFFFKLCTFFRK